MCAPGLPVRLSESVRTGAILARLLQTVADGIMAALTVRDREQVGQPASTLN